MFASCAVLYSAMKHFTSKGMKREVFSDAWLELIAGNNFLEQTAERMHSMRVACKPLSYEVQECEDASRKLARWAQDKKDQLMEVFTTYPLSKALVKGLEERSATAKEAMNREKKLEAMIADFKAGRLRFSALVGHAPPVPKGSWLPDLPCRG